MDQKELESILNYYQIDGEKNEVINNIFRIEEHYSKEDVVEILNYFLTKTENPNILMNIIRNLDKYRSKTSLSPMIDLLMMKDKSNNIDDFVNVRVMCAKAIANLKDTTAVVPLLYCLNDKSENYKVRLACADALGRIGDKYAVAPLIDLVSDEDEKSIYVRETAASALGMLGDDRAIDPLVSILEAKKGFLDKFTFLKERVIEALNKLNIKNDRVFMALKKSLEDESPQIRINAIEALMDMEDSRAEELIKKALKDDDEEVRKNALIALYNIEGACILKEVQENSEYDDFLKNEAHELYIEYEDEEEHNE